LVIGSRAVCYPFLLGDALSPFCFGGCFAATLVLVGDRFMRMLYCCGWLVGWILGIFFGVVDLRSLFSGLEGDHSVSFIDLIK